MFSFLKYVIFAIGLLAVYVLIEHFIVNRGGEQTIDDTVNQAVSDVQSAGEQINEEYIQPTLEKAGME